MDNSDKLNMENRGCSGLFAEVNKRIRQPKCVCVIILHGCIARYTESVSVLGKWSFILVIISWRAQEQQNNTRAVNMSGQPDAAKAQYSFWRTDWEIPCMNKEVLLFLVVMAWRRTSMFLSSCFNCLSESYNFCYESWTSGTNDTPLFWGLIVILQRNYKGLKRIEKRIIEKYIILGKNRENFISLVHQREIKKWSWEEMAYCRWYFCQKDESVRFRIWKLDLDKLKESS